MFCSLPDTAGKSSAVRFGLGEKSFAVRFSGFGKIGVQTPENVVN